MKFWPEQEYLKFPRSRLLAHPLPQHLWSDCRALALGPTQHLMQVRLESLVFLGKFFFLAWQERFGPASFARRTQLSTFPSKTGYRGQESASQVPRQGMIRLTRLTIAWAPWASWKNDKFVHSVYSDTKSSCQLLFDLTRRKETALAAVSSQGPAQQLAWIKR